MKQIWRETMQTSKRCSILYEWLAPNEELHYFFPILSISFHSHVINKQFVLFRDTYSESKNVKHSSKLLISCNSYQSKLYSYTTFDIVCFAVFAKRIALTENYRLLQMHDQNYVYQ